MSREWPSSSKGSERAGLQLRILHASTDAELDTVFPSLIQLQKGGLVIGGDPFFNSRAKQLAALSVRYAVPTVYQFSEFTAAGGLASYGASWSP
jgi:putative tryptophan/tyrosine transport system substrate-binding protein